MHFAIAKCNSDSLQKTHTGKEELDNNSKRACRGRALMANILLENELLKILVEIMFPDKGPIEENPVLLETLKMQEMREDEIRRVIEDDRCKDGKGIIIS